MGLQRVALSRESRPFADEMEWADEIRRGNGHAFDLLFDAYYDDLVDFVNTYVHRVSVAEELVQDIFLNVWRLGSAWKPRGALRTYLFGAARKQAYMHMRRRRVENRWRDEETWNARERTGPSPETTLRHDEISRVVAEAVGELPERRRAVFTLSRQHGLSYAEIAAVLDISTNTVEKHMVRALKQLRERLSPYL